MKDTQAGLKVILLNLLELLHPPVEDGMGNSTWTSWRDHKCKDELAAKFNKQ